MNMKNTTMAAGMAMLLAVPALAGGKGYHCDMEAQKCLDEMCASFKNRGWVGIEMDQDEEKGTMTVKRVVPGSPAEAGGFKVGDVLVAVNGIEFGKANEEKLKKNHETMVPGAKAEYTVSRAGSDAKVSVTLGKIPSDVLAQWVGMHMMEHSKVEIAQK
jgi:C-terminal processing protease CtpA/Prc